MAGTGRAERPEREDPGTAALKCFGRQLKLFRERAGLTQAALGRQIGYSDELVGSVEQGRRVAQPAFIDAADRALDAGGVLAAAKESVANARYPEWFRDFARMEAEALELHAYDTMVVNGLLQTEEYARAVFTLRRPLLDEDVVEQRVTARLERQAVLTRKPPPLLGFVLDEAVLRRTVGDVGVMRGQLRHLLAVGGLRNVDIQVMPLAREDHAGLGGPLTLITPKNGRTVAYQEGHGHSRLITDAPGVRAGAARHGVIRAQALTPRESMNFVETLLGES
ncbi:helix-turn-helix domain-containing protein [Streptacidiphilus griseoplanus]|uniref:helix-turn-helix domain-containing protein n=1 Tax=Peterkaempfera griseoplana TaxID=66896 RepID=UPI0006E4097F|nr:helix-turn-helix transcriptional regulator [Peterkaempfera griseoplana]